MKDDRQQYEDLIETEDAALSLKDIASIAGKQNVRKRFEKEYGAGLYSKMLLVLTHERYEPAEAVKLWDTITRHLGALTGILGRNPGISVAALDYLANIRHLLVSPVIIEEDKSYFIAETGTKDGLTQLYMRSVFDVILGKELEKRFRSQDSLSLLMIDIDDFKQVNDRHGHPAGDDVLRALGKLINRNSRNMDTAARYGGEELAVIVPESPPGDVVALAERIRKKIAKLAFAGFSVTVSIGICHASADSGTTGELIEGADKALYEAKRSGKNRVVVFRGNQ